MLGRYLLAALADGVAAADEDIARRSISRIDWVLRGYALRRLNTLLMDAALETGVIHLDDASERRHILRAAALMEMGETDLDFRDREAVSTTYADKTAVSPPRFPIATVAAGALVLALTTTIAAATVVVVTAPVPGAIPGRPTPPPPAGAFAVGGSPGHEHALEQLFVDQLPNIVAHRIVDRNPPALTGHPGVAAAWRELVEAAPGIDVEDRWKEPEELKVRLQVLSDQLAAANLGYFAAVERTQRNEVVIGVYKIAKITFVRADRERVRVLDAVRLKQEAVKPVLGMKADGVDDPIVMLDQVTAHVANQYLPVLDGRPYSLSDDGWDRGGRGRSATMAATRAIRREINAALGNDANSIDRATIRLRKLVLASVRHHEAQHGHEQDRQPAYPAELAQVVGPLRDAQGRVNTMAVRARNELSAYTSQIASDMWLPQAALWNLARHAFQSGRRGSPESYAAVLVIEGLARQLDIMPASAKSALDGSKIDRDRLAELVAPLASKTTVELRSAAARLWGELFDEPLVRLVDDVFGE